MPESGEPLSSKKYRENEESNSSLDVLRGELTGKPYKKYEIPHYDGYRGLKGSLEGYDLLSAHKNETSNTSWTIKRVVHSKLSK